MVAFPWQSGSVCEREKLGGWAARMYGWAAEELAGRRLPASPEQLEEEERDNAYDKAGFLSFMEFGGFDLGQAGY